jgi:hypothetical protein
VTPEEAFHNMKAAIAEYGVKVVSLAFSMFTKPMLPFCHLLMKEQATNAMARECGLTDTEVEQAFRLMKNLKASLDAHHAFVAAQTIRDKAPDQGLLIGTQLLTRVV